MSLTTTGAGASKIPGGGEFPGIGVIVPYDMALDRELWRWTPDDVSLYLTRTPFAPLPVGVAMAAVVGDDALVTASVRDLSAVSPQVYAYACTSGSFVRGRDGEQSLVDAMVSAGAPAAVTTSGALLEALQYLGVQRIGIATPYDEALTALLRNFLLAAGDLEVVGSSQLGLDAGVWKVPPDRVEQLIRQADHDGADAIVVSCTNLPTYDVIASLEAQLGKPVVTANQATMWSALRRMGRAAIGPQQILLQPDPSTSQPRTSQPPTSQPPISDPLTGIERDERPRVQHQHPGATAATG